MTKYLLLHAKVTGEQELDQVQDLRVPGFNFVQVGWLAAWARHSIS